MSSGESVHTSSAKLSFLTELQHICYSVLTYSRRASDIL